MDTILFIGAVLVCVAAMEECVLQLLGIDKEDLARRRTRRANWLRWMA